MKKTYEKPELQIVSFENADIITASDLVNGGEGSGPVIDAGDIFGTNTLGYN